MKEFLELKLASMSMDGYEKRFFGLLKNVDFINMKNSKSKGFLVG
jgi:hypothetical protein